MDLSKASLGTRSTRYALIVRDGKITYQAGQSIIIIIISQRVLINNESKMFHFNLFPFLIFFFL